VRNRRQVVAEVTATARPPGHNVNHALPGKRNLAYPVWHRAGRL